MAFPRCPKCNAEIDPSKTFAGACLKCDWRPKKAPSAFSDAGESFRSVSLNSSSGTITSARGELGSRLARLGSFVTNLILLFGVVFVGGLLSVLAEKILTAPSWLGWLLPLLFAMAFLAYQWLLISRDGQTVGKKLANLRVVAYDTGEPPGFLRGVLLREIVTYFLSSIPLFALADALFIFSEEGRCLHDHLAGTIVEDV